MFGHEQARYAFTFSLQGLTPFIYLKINIFFFPLDVDRAQFVNIPVLKCFVLKARY